MKRSTIRLEPRIPEGNPPLHNSSSIVDAIAYANPIGPANVTNLITGTIPDEMSQNDVKPDFEWCQYDLTGFFRLTKILHGFPGQ